MTRKGTFFFCATSLLILFSLPMDCYSYEKKSHDNICAFISDKTIDGFSFDQYMKTNLGFNLGVSHVFAEQTIMDLAWFGILPKKPLSAKELLAEGGRDEDSPVFRSLNHFHNPLVPWDQAGFHQGQPIIGGESSVLWAQENRSTQSYGEYSWHDVRHYFYTALTSTSIAARTENLVKTFRGVGHLIHLIQDASVPEHVRNDAHLFGYTYEKFILEKLDNSWLSNQAQYTFTSSAFSLPPHSDAPIPIARIVDTDRYVGTNPSDTMGQPIGLAEYANANFFSKDTIFKTDAYPFPSWGSVNAGPMQIQNPRDSSGTVSRQYLTKVQDGDTGYRLCTAPVLYGQVPESAEYQAPTLDENVYGDYAQRLIPRAVAYSAGLLKYFFRGAIEITVPENGIYAFRNSISTRPREEGFSRITLRAKNVSEENEEMLGGTLELVIKYKLPEFDPLINHQAPYPAYPTEYQYIVAPLDSNSDHVIPRGNSIALEFTLPRDLPLWATDVSLSLVYKGKLGKNGGFVEEDAVGVGFKDISEPTPVDVINSTDYLCMENSWYHVADPQILAQVQGVLGDQFPYDVSSRHIPVTYVRFSRADNPLNASSSEGAYTHAVHDLEGATYKRMFTLSDYTYHISIHNSGWDLVTSKRPGLKSQEDHTPEGAKVRTIPSFRIYRGIPAWNEVVFLLRNICRGEDDKLNACSSGCEDIAVPDGLELVP